MGRRSLFIHAGLHKTGTTALQSALASNPSWLTAHGYRFPLSGRPWGGGHHNIAWELTHDRRYRAEYGTIRDLLAEVRDDDCNVILSSEDFTGALAHVSRFRDFVNALRDPFPDVCIVLFLRNQADYATSLYLELLAHGFDWTFKSFLNEIVTQGAFRWREWCYPFNFEEFLCGISKMEGVRLKVCSYDVSKNEALLDVFLKACELPEERLETTSLPRENIRRPSGWYVAQFLVNRTGTPVDPAQSLILDHIQQAWGNRWIGLSAEDHRFIAGSVRESNEHVSAVYGVPLNRFMTVAPPTENSGPMDLAMSSLFSGEVQALFADSSMILRREMEKTDVSREALATVSRPLEAKRDHLRIERNEVVTATASLTEQSRLLSENCKSLSADINEARARSAALAEELAAARADAQALALERDALAVELRAINAARNELAVERTSILSSRSWKLTAPLRRLMLQPGFREAKAKRTQVV